MEVNQNKPSELILIICEELNEKIWELCTEIKTKLLKQPVIMNIGQIGELSDNTIYMKDFTKENFIAKLRKTETRYGLKIKDVIIINQDNHFVEYDNSFCSDTVLSQVYRLNKISDILEALHSMKISFILNIILKHGEMKIFDHVFLESSRALFKALCEKFSILSLELFFSEELFSCNIKNIIFSIEKREEVLEKEYQYSASVIDFSLFRRDVETNEMVSRAFILNNFIREGIDFMDDILECEKFIFNNKTDFSEQFDWLSINEEEQKISNDLIFHFTDDYTSFDFQDLNYEVFYKFLEKEIGSFLNFIALMNKKNSKKIFITTFWDGRSRDLNYIIYQALYGLCQGLRTEQGFNSINLIGVGFDTFLSLKTNRQIDYGFRKLLEKLIDSKKKINAILISEAEIENQTSKEIRNYSTVCLKKLSKVA